PSRMAGSPCTGSSARTPHRRRAPTRVTTRPSDRMALATQCPHCHTTFRVASDQLKLRGGIVRCGACQRIFDGNSHLIDLDALAAARKASEAQAAAADAAAADADA